MDGVTLTYQGRDQLMKRLQRVSDPSTREGLLDVIGSYGVSSTQERFLQKKDPDGGAWKENRRGGQILRDSNRLFQSLTHQATANQVAWGTNLIYAAPHQFGAIITPKRGKKLKFAGVSGGFVFVDKVTIPKRAFLGIDGHDETEIETITHDWLRGMLQ